MKFALVEGKRARPQPSLVGLCCLCGEHALAKCGSQIRWHWAHKGRRHCDPWWENETDWHRGWKSYFPEHMHENVLFDDQTGEKHIADVRTDHGLIIEIQHSAMPIEELYAREAFYKNMVWIVDGKPFASQFKIEPDRLPHPQAPFLDDVVFFSGHASAFWRRSEAEPGAELVLYHQADEIMEQILEHYRGHHFFKWTRPRHVWLKARAPVFIDFGGGRLYQICEYPPQGYRCIQIVSKKQLVEVCGGQYIDL